MTIDQCPWYVGVRDATHAILLVLLLPVITLKYYDITNGSAMLTDLITWRQYWTSQPFIFLAAAFIVRFPPRGFFLIYNSVTEPLEVVSITSHLPWNTRPRNRNLYSTRTSGLRLEVDPNVCRRPLGHCLRAFSLCFQAPSRQC